LGLNLKDEGLKYQKVNGTKFFLFLRIFFIIDYLHL